MYQLLEHFHPCNRGLLLFSFWKRAESDCLHIRLTISIVLRFIHRISTIHPPFNLVCRQSLSALFQKLNNNNPLLSHKETNILLVMLCFSLSFCNIDAPMRKISFREEFCSKQRPRLLVPENFLFCRDEIPSLQNCAGRFIST